MADDQITWLVAGLGNPGDRYAGTRHNIGFMVTDLIGTDLRIEIRPKNIAGVAYGIQKLGGRRLIIAKPLNYMNNSGPPLRRIADYYRITTDRIIIVHDDIDLSFGRIKIIEKGGDGGHKGVSSIIQSFGGEKGICRIRIGVGRGQSAQNVVNYVLGRFSKEEQARLEALMIRARDAVYAVVLEGVKQAMNRFNRKQKTDQQLN